MIINANVLMHCGVNVLAEWYIVEEVKTLDGKVSTDMDLNSVLRTQLFPGILKGCHIYSSLRGTSMFHCGSGWNEHDPVCHCFYLWFDLNNATSHITVALSGCLILDLSSCQLYCLTACGKVLFQPSIPAFMSLLHRVPG